MDDLIKRQDAIDVATQEGAYGYISAWELAQIPSAEQAQKTGYWIPWKAYYGEDRKSWSDELKCSECGYKWGDEEYKFCPSCGCRMVGEEE